MRGRGLAGFTTATATALMTACTQAPQSDWIVTPQHSGTSTSLRGLSVVDDQVVWIGAPDGQVLRTRDGGATWQVMTVALAQGADLRSAHGFDDQRALFVTAGQPARIIETRDGGASFALVWEDQSGAAFFDSLAFWDAERGLAYSDPVDGEFLILRTLDGGLSWNSVEVDPVPLDGEAGFAASNSSIGLTPDGCAYIGTGGGAVARILRTCDFGDTWEARDTPMAAGSAGAGIFAVLAGPDDRLAVSGGDYQAPESRAGNFAYSEDRGETWQTVEAPPLGYRSDLVVLGSTWIAVGTTGVDLGVRSGTGVRWQASDWDLPAPNAIAASPSGETAWIIGANGGIWRVEPK